MIESSLAQITSPERKLSIEKRPIALIVEDESLVAEYLRETAIKLGYAASVFDDGVDAVEFAKTIPPDLVILDIKIKSELNGVETAVIIQGIYESSIPVVFVTAYPESEFPLLKAVYPYIYLRKFFSENALVEALRNAANLPR